MSLQTSAQPTGTSICSSCSFEWHDLDSQCPCWMNNPRTRYDDSFIPLKSEPVKSKALVTATRHEPSKMSYGTLGREQVMKGVFMQLGDKAGLPKEVVILIWQSMKQSEIDDEDLVREYHLCSIYMISNHITSHTFERNHVLHPINRGIEWSIKWSGWCNAHKITKIREEMHSHIQIIGEEYYLVEHVGEQRVAMAAVEGEDGPVEYVFEPVWASASRRTKIQYVNSCRGGGGGGGGEVTQEYELWKLEDRSFQVQVFDPVALPELVPH